MSTPEYCRFLPMISEGMKIALKNRRELMIMPGAKAQRPASSGEPAHVYRPSSCNSITFTFARSAS
jgi:hypothetical protein